MQAEPIEQVHHVRRKADAHRHVGDGVFQNQIPADDPGDEFAHGGVGVGVRAAGDRNHRRQFRVADRCEAAYDGHQNEGNRDGGAGAGAAKGSGMSDQILKQRGVQDRRDLQFLAGDRGADNGENSGANDGADSQRRQAQPSQGFL